MTLDEIKKQAIGKYFFSDGFNMGKITDVRPSIYRGMLDVVAEWGRANFIRRGNFARLLRGKPVRQTRVCNGRACRECGFAFYEIKEKLPTNSEYGWSKTLSPIAPIWRHISGMNLDDIGKGRQILYTGKETAL